VDAVTLLRQAALAGLTIVPEGDKLQVHSPRSAEPVVRLLAQNKPMILAEVASWRRLYDESLEREIEMAKRRDRWANANAGERIAIAKRVAWGTVEVRWHLERGERPDPDCCAGCCDPIEEGSALELADGAQVHIADGDACIIAYGRKWRGATATGLHSVGLDPPEGITLL
jgi:hypothetical protein